MLFWRTRSRQGFKCERTWLSWNARFAGKPAGSLRKDGYVTVNLPGYGATLAHRIVWKMWYGSDPTYMIDHKNGRRHDNRIRNLREAEDEENQYNAKTRSDNTSGIKGVSWHDGKWRARIQANGKAMFLGHFTDKGAAEAAVATARRALHKEYARHA